MNQNQKKEELETNMEKKRKWELEDEKKRMWWNWGWDKYD